ncbi:MAG: hypothetical protein JF567_08390 [Xanthomonadales bacterium]|nr:hypothetical protein [Xanthomonadales bacterium]
MAGTLVMFATVVPARAGTYRVDDSASQVLSSNVEMKWHPMQAAPAQRNIATGNLTVIVRLDVAKWAGHPGRIYMRMPASAVIPTITTWTSRGTLLPGTLRDGERTLVYAGPIPVSGRIEDTLMLTIQADARRLSRPEQLQYNFEIDVDTP